MGSLVPPVVEESRVAAEVARLVISLVTVGSLDGRPPRTAQA
jgi:hypothetical protein